MENAKCMREKYWEECNEAEKFERMRDVVKQQANTIERLLNDVNLLRMHQHAQDGRLLVPPDALSQNSALGRVRNSAWF